MVRWRVEMDEIYDEGSAARKSNEFATLKWLFILGDFPAAPPITSP